MIVKIERLRNLTTARVVQLLIFLYLFLVSINLMSASMKLFGKGFAETLIANTSNPVVGLFIGILSTSIIQSSSSTTSIVVSMVAGGVLNIANAIPIIMGANIGTSVTNILVSLVHINRSNEFKRSFSASMVHDFFNVLSVITFFPLQYYFNFLGKVAIGLERIFSDVGGLNFLNPVKATTEPVVHLMTDTIGNYPWVLLVLALLILFLSLKQMVNALHVLVVKKAESWFDKVLFKNQLRAFSVGMVLTMLAQSSSITTSLVVPMAGAGILTINQIFPYTLGANIGTTITAILAALVTTSPDAVVVAFAHLLFNVSGIIIWWPLKKVPIRMSELLSEYATRNKLVPIGYIIIVFFVIPISIIFLYR
jgi:sodium-dependent phosphate cotransporter